MDEPPGQTMFIVLTLMAVLGFLGGSFLSAVRTSLFSLDKQELPPFDDPALSGNKRTLMRLLRRPARLVIGIGVGELAGYAGALTFGTAAALIHYSPLDDRDLVISGAVFLVIGLLVLLLGRVLLMHYMGTPDFALDWAPLLQFSLWCLFPIIWMTEKLMFRLNRPDEFLMKSGAQELDIWPEAPPGDDELEEEEREMIRSIYDFGDTTAREIMTPRTYLQAIELRTPPVKVLEFIAQSRFSRFPVYDTTLDNIVGVLHVKDLMKFVVGGKLESLDLRKASREPYIVPETKKLDELLQEIKENRKQMVIVIDEYGGVAGVVTIEDILEEIVGEIQDEYDDEVKLAIRLEDGAYVLSARLSTEEMNEELGTEIEEEDFDTLGGLVFTQLGRVPVKDDRFEYGGWEFTVMSVHGNRIGMVRAEPSKNTGANLERTYANGSSRGRDGDID